MQLKYPPMLAEMLISDNVFERDDKLKTVATKIIKDLESENFSMEEINEILNLCKIQNKKDINAILNRRIEELKSNGEEEIWKKHPHDERYAVSSLGRFILLKNKFTFGSLNVTNGYMSPPPKWLKIGSFVHIVVAKMFPELVENSGDDERKFVGHRDDVKYHNNASNLICLTPQENSTWGNIRERQASKTYNPIRCIETGDVFPTITHAAEVILQDPKYKELHNLKKYSLISEISQHVRNSNKYSHVHGFHFEKIEY